MLWSTVYGVHRPARCFFFFNDTATTEIYTLSLHDALPISLPARLPYQITERERSLTVRLYGGASDINWMQYGDGGGARSEEHTSELQSRSEIVCRLLFEKKIQKPSDQDQFRFVLLFGTHPH